MLVAAGAIALAPAVQATAPEPTDGTIRRFLAQDDTQPAYRAKRRLHAENGGRAGWLEAVTEYSATAGFRYVVTAEGGSGYIRNKVLRAVLDGEAEAIHRGETARSSLDLTNYTFEPKGMDADGLAQVLVSPRREERVLIAGSIFLKPTDGALVRLEGRLAKSPSFWVKNVDIVRSYQRIGGTVVPTALDSKAQLRMLGPATLSMTYAYLEVDGHPVASPTSTDHGAP